MVNVLLVLSYYAEHADDPGNFTRSLAEHINNTKNNVIILAPHKKDTELYEEMGDIKVYRFPYFIPYKYEILAYNSGLAYNSKRYLLAKFQIIPFLIMELLFTLYIIRKENISIVNTHWLLPQGLIGSIVRKLTNIKHVATIHSSEVTLLKKNSLTKKIAIFIVKNSDSLISVSKHRLNELIEILPNKVTQSLLKKINYIPMGVKVRDTTTVTPHILKDFINIIFVGRLVEVKGCEYLIQGFSYAIKNCTYKKKLKLNIIGYGDQEEQLKQLTSNLKMNEYVIFHGKVKNNEVYRYYNSSDILILPSIVDKNGYQEGFPVVLLEAIAAGLPIIATNIAGVKEVINNGENGIIIDEKNPEQIGKAILKLTDDYDLRKKLADNCLKERNRYTWEKISEEYNDIFEKIIGG